MLGVSARLAVPANITIVPLPAKCPELNPQENVWQFMRDNWLSITIVPLPAKCPELNPQENVWQFMRDNWLSNRVFTGYDNIVDHCVDAWNKLVAQPWRIMTLGLRDWAHRS